MVNEFLKGNILEISDNQIKDNNPVCTRVTLERLMSLSYTETQAREMIGAQPKSATMILVSVGAAKSIKSVVTEISKKGERYRWIG